MSASAAAVAAAATAPILYASDEDDATDDTAYLQSLLVQYGTVVSPDLPYPEMLRTLYQAEYAHAARLCQPSERQHHVVIQDISGQWGKMRRGPEEMRIGGSEIGDAIGLSVYAFPIDLYNKMLAQQDGTWADDFESKACDHGTTCEDIIAEMFARYMKRDLQDGGYFAHPDANFLGHLYGASPDRIVLSRGPALDDGVPAGEPYALLEIKAPFGETLAMHNTYLAQMMYQMWCSGIPRCYFSAVKLRPDATDSIGAGIGPRSTPPGETRVLLRMVHYSEAYMTWAIPRLLYFSNCIATRTPPPRELYTSEVYGREATPDVRIDEVNVEVGSWRAETPKAFRARVKLA